MSFLFDSFEGWNRYCQQSKKALYEPVLEYEIEQKGASEPQIWQNLDRAYGVMKEAVRTGAKTIHPKTRVG